MPEDAQDLIDRLLKVEPKERLGANKQFMDLKGHKFFSKFNFSKLNEFKVELDPDLFKTSEPNSPIKIEPEPRKKSITGIVFQGELVKKNKYFWGQKRTFYLYETGEIKYYEDKVLFKVRIGNFIFLETNKTY